MYTCIYNTCTCIYNTCTCKLGFFSFFMLSLSLQSSNVQTKSSGKYSQSIYNVQYIHVHVLWF